MSRELLGLLARHGETALNASNCYRSRLDPPLNDNGLTEADRLAAYITKKYKVYKVVSSPMLRAIQTADAIAEKVGCKVNQDRGLFPWALGFLAGKDKEQYDHILRFYVKNPTQEIPDGESLRDFEERVEDFFRDALKANYSEAPIGTLEGGYDERGPFHCADCIHKTAPSQPYCIHSEILSSVQMKDRAMKVHGQRVVQINLQKGCCEYVKPVEEKESKIQLWVTHTSIIVTLGNIFEGKRDMPETGDADVLPGGLAEIWSKDDGDYEIIPVIGQEHAAEGE